MPAAPRQVIDDPELVLRRNDIAWIGGRPRYHHGPPRLLSAVVADAARWLDQRRLLAVAQEVAGGSYPLQAIRERHGMVFFEFRRLFRQRVAVAGRMPSDLRGSLTA